MVRATVSTDLKGRSRDATSSSTVVATTLFQGNGANGTIGSDFIILANGDPLFVNPALNNYYPAPGSAAVDSSLNSLSDRPAFTAVKNPLGIPNSDLVAPEFDLFGQQRQDDPGQVNAGLGSDIFKDRGAIERADFGGPWIEACTVTSRSLPERLTTCVSIRTNAMLLRISGVVTNVAW